MRWVILAAALSLGPSAQASEALSLEQALQEALGQNPALATSRLQAERAEAGVLSARSLWDPQLSIASEYNTATDSQVFGTFVFDTNSDSIDVNSSLRGSLETGTSYLLRGTFSSFDQVGSNSAQPDLEQTFLRTSPNMLVQVDQELIRGHRTAFNRRQIISARNQVDVATLQVEEQLQRTLADVGRAYWTWVNATQLADIATERANVAQEALRIGVLQLREGRLAPVDVARLETEYVRAQKSIVDARQAADEASDALLLLMGRTPGEVLTPATQMTRPSTEQIDVAGAIQTALDGNVGLRVATLQADQATLSVKLARHGTLPSLQLSASGFWRRNNDTRDGEKEPAVNLRSLTGGATFSMPLGNRSARGELASASADEAIQRQTLEQQKRQVSADVARQVRTLNAAAEQVRLADQEVKLAETTLRAEEARASTGRAVQRDVLEARTAVFDAKASAAKARADHQLAIVELRRLQGSLDVGAFTP